MADHSDHQPLLSRRTFLRLMGGAATPLDLGSVWCPDGPAADGGSHSAVERAPSNQRQCAATRWNPAGRLYQRGFELQCAPSF
ncbi:MAG: hypothetical protein WCG26_10470 [Chloroflexales bacterium]